MHNVSAKCIKPGLSPACTDNSILTVTWEPQKKIKIKKKINGRINKLKNARYTCSSLQVFPLSGTQIGFEYE